MSRIEHYRACAARGMSINEVARLYEVTPHAVRQANIKHRLGFQVKPCKRDRNLKDMRERVEALASQSKNRREISVELQVPFKTVIRWCREWRIGFAHCHGIRKPVLDMVAERITDAERNDLLLLKRKGYTFRDAFVALRRPDLLAFLP